MALDTMAEMKIGGRTGQQRGPLLLFDAALASLHRPRDYRGKDDGYSKAFGDLLITLQGYRRFKDGDNRPLPIRGDKR